MGSSSKKKAANRGAPAAATPAAPPPPPTMAMSTMPDGNQMQYYANPSEVPQGGGLVLPRAGPGMLQGVGLNMYTPPPPPPPPPRQQLAQRMQPQQQYQDNYGRGARGMSGAFGWISAAVSSASPW